ncbi:MAG: hypothetical protein ABW199_05740 [Caulobacterales bacterium]
MYSVALLCFPDEAAYGRAIAHAWPERGAIVVEAELGKRPPSFGSHMMVCVLFDARASTDPDQVLAAVNRAKARGVVLLYGGSAPEPFVRNSLPVIVSAGEAADDVDVLRRVHAEMTDGSFVQSKYRLQTAQPLEKAQPRNRNRRPVVVPGPFRPQRVEAQDLDFAQRKKVSAGRYGFIVGAVIGVALFFGFAAPSVSRWLTRDAPPPTRPLAEELKQASTIAAPPPAKTAPGSTDIQALPEEAPLRGLTEAPDSEQRP